MLPEDREQKVAEFENKRQAWISILIRGKARFVLLHGVLREAIFLIAWNVLFTVHMHLNIKLVAQVTVFVLVMGRVFNLLELHWNERRFRSAQEQGFFSNSQV